MVNSEKKLEVLGRIGELFNNKEITWAIGASLLLYFEGITDTFHDIDIMVHEDDVAKAKEILLSLGQLCPPNPNAQYTTKYFYEFVIDGVDVDVMAGFTIVCDGKEYDCSLQKQQIEKYIEMNGVRIPLQSISLWREYYRLMKRENKVAMIDNKYTILWQYECE